MRLTQLFCDVDDFCQDFIPKWETQLLKQGQRKRRRSSRLSMSEMITLMIHFHQSHYRNFKAYYLGYVCKHVISDFPHLLSYSRFVELIPSVVIPLAAYLKKHYGNCRGIAYIDSTKLPVCHHKRMSRNSVFKGLAAIGKSTMGWFYGFKLHLIVNERGEFLSVKLTEGNVDDRKPLPDMCQTLMGKLFGDKGYISQSLHDELLENNLELITSIRSNMKPKLLTLIDKLLLRKRSVIETINDQLKNISQIEHSRHRSPINFAVNLLAGLIAYCKQPKKPSIKVDYTEVQQIMAV